MKIIEKYNNALNENIDALSKLYKQEDKGKIKRLIFEEVDKFNLLIPEELYKRAYLYSCELIKNELI